MIRPVLALCVGMAPVIAGVPLVPMAQAQTTLERCQTSLRGQQYEFAYDADNTLLQDSRSMREKLFGGKGDITCPGLVTLRALTPEMEDKTRGAFCLQWDKENETYIGYAEGAQDGLGHCRAPSRSFCERVNGSTQAAKSLTGSVGDVARDTTGKVVGEDIGAVVVETTGAKLRDRLQDAGIAALAAATPAGLAAVAVTAVVVGGTVYVCSDSGAGGADVEGVPQDPQDGATVTVEGLDQLGADLPEETPADAITPAPVPMVETTPLTEPEAPPAPVPPTCATGADCSSAP
ncbi:hypothetical protein BFP70_11195 [Thioclava sp. SK-1]|uniref:hypothetical protein n=1 Tax=Thioclava sp. SK-1 TaxID=1889770 RepID=UPI000824971F|nr:hypothetical protein [Thioclava sp. SK-1]OCX64586.1 hypothetical protein BFP70_11195 [Thioclava sp. SK-1]